jgi:uncharacterized protein (TIGR02391 family)
MQATMPPPWHYALVLCWEPSRCVRPAWLVLEFVGMIPPFNDASLDALSRTLGEALVGSDISRILAACHVVDTSGESTKWKRIYYTFLARQQHDRCANAFGSFIETALAPARWSGRRSEHAEIRQAVNEALLLSGIELGSDGKLRSVKAAADLDESAERANRLRAKLQQRSVHREVLKFSQRLLIRDGNYFHAVFETTKSVMERLRSMSGSREDGNALVDATLECGKRPFPIIALNRYDTVSLQNDQRGVAHLARGLVHAFRNVTAHEPQTEWHISEADALDMMSIASLIHRRLDGAVVTTAFQPLAL